MATIFKKPYSLTELAAAKEKMVGVRPQAAAPAEAAPEPKKKFDWGGAIRKGLQGASAAIQANVGPTDPGQEFSQGLQRGIIGAGTVSAGMAAQDAAAARRKQGLSDSLGLLMAKEGLKPKEPSWEDKFKMTEAGKDRRQQAGVQSALDKASKMAELGRKAGKSDKDMTQIRKDSYKQAWEEYLKSDLDPNAPDAQAVIQNRADQIAEFILDPKADKINLKRD